MGTVSILILFYDLGLFVIRADSVRVQGPVEIPVNQDITMSVSKGVHKPCLNHWVNKTST